MLRFQASHITHLLAISAAAAALACVSGDEAGAQSAYTPRPTYSYGAEPSPVDAVKRFKVASVSRAYVPEAVDLSPRFPKPGQQEHNSCVSWSVGYAARSYYENASSAAGQARAQQIASPAYMHNRIYRREKSCTEAGALFIDAFKLLQEEGAPSLARYPADQTCAGSGTAAAAGSLGFRIRDAELIAFAPTSYAGVVKGEMKAPSDINVPLNVDLVRQKLAAGHPVLMQMAVGQSFKDLGAGQIYQGGVGRQGGPAGTPERDIGNHAMVVVGYDDRRQAVRIMNSWGSEWADAGYGWVSYDALRRDVSEAWTMVPEQAPVRPSPAEGDTQVSDVAQQLKLDCAELGVAAASGGKPELQGFVSTDFDLKLARDYAAREKVGFNVKVNPWPVCEALLTLRGPLRAQSRPAIRPLSGSTVHRIGSTLAVEVTAPDFPSYLYAFYLQADGTIVNLVPRTGPIRPQTQPGQVMLFGDGKNGRPSFKVAPPTGHETIIAIAARSPLKQLEDLEVPGTRPFRLTFAPEDQRNPEDRAFLSRLRQELVLRPDPAQLPREIAAEVLHITIED